MSLFALCFCSANAQVGHYNSPYSYFGIGDLTAGQFAGNIAQGYTGLGSRSLTNVSLMNPASYTGLYFTSFDLGVHMTGNSLNDNNLSQTVSGAGISYLNLSFPATRYLAFSAGLVPYSQVNYEIDETRNDDDLGQQEIQYRGFGTIYKFYGGAAGKYKRLSVGFNLSYFFGNQTHLLNTEYPDQVADLGSFLSLQRSERNQFGGLNTDFGAQYDLPLNKDLNIVIGATFKPAQKVGYQSQQNLQRVVRSATTGEVFNVDSTVVFDITDLDQEIELPSEFGFGIELVNKKGWGFSADVRQQAWSKANLNRLKADEHQDRLIVSLGTTLSPNRNKEGSSKSIWRRMEYRFGAYYDSYYLKLNDTSLPSFGLTFGFGIPLRGKVEAALLDSGVPFSRLNLSFDLGQKGTTDNQLIQETYFRVTAGFSMNSKWFVKRRYD